MKKLIVLFVLLFALPLYGAEVKLVWDANTETDLAGYKIHWSDTNTVPYPNIVDVGNVTTYTLTDIVVGTTYWIAASAYDSNGNESAYSDIIQYTAEADRVIIIIMQSPKKLRVESVFE